MAEREDLPAGDTTPPTPPTVAELREVNEQLLIAGLREQELAAMLATERAQLAVILTSIGDAVLVVDAAGRLVRSNAAYARMVGGAVPLAPQDAHGHPLPPEATPQARAAAGEAFSLEFALTAADGSLRWFEANGQPLHDQGAGRAVVVVRDITLSSQHRHLQDEFLALASHELRTPLTSIQGYLDLILRHVQGTTNERLVRYATQAREQARRLTALVRDLTDVARLQSGKLTLARAPVDLGTLVARVVAMARDLPPGHPIYLDTGAELLRVEGDAGRLEQVVLNLLTNTFAHAPSVEPAEVRLRRPNLYPHFLTGAEDAAHGTWR